MWDFVTDKSGAGAGFLRELRFPLPIYIPSASPQSSSLSPETGTTGQEWPQCQQPHKPNNNNKKIDTELEPFFFVFLFIGKCQVPKYATFRKNALYDNMRHILAFYHNSKFRKYLGTIFLLYLNSVRSCSVGYIVKGKESGTANP
jgi:hypothetical protein